MIIVKDLVKRYGDLIALNHFNIEIKKGEIYGLLGPNGSGKSTAINCILSLLKYDKGEIEILGKKMSPTAYELKNKIGIITQEVAVFEELNVYDNIDYFCGLYIDDKKLRKQYVKEAIEFVGIENFSKFRPSKLSGGLLRRLNIACGIAHKPEIIILDEPTVAVDPQSRENILLGIEKLNKNGATILYTSHYIEEVERICTRVSIMDKGKIIETGTIDELKNIISYSEIIKLGIIEENIEFQNEISRIESTIDIQHFENKLLIKTKKENQLIEILKIAEKHNIDFTDILVEKPSLNDVFLEITGKELRDV